MYAIRSYYAPSSSSPPATAAGCPAGRTPRRRPQPPARHTLTHRRCRGSTSAPRRRKPARITYLIAQWFRDGHCQEAIFNLKLPMKKRYAEVEHDLAVLKEWLAELDGEFVIQAKQLYHDREEITVHVYDESYNFV